MKKFVIAFVFSVSCFATNIGQEVNALNAAIHSSEVLKLLADTFDISDAVERIDHQSFEVTFSYKKHTLGIIPHSGTIVAKILAKKSSLFNVRMIKYEVIEAHKLK